MLRRLLLLLILATAAPALAEPAVREGWEVNAEAVKQVEFELGPLPYWEWASAEVELAALDRVVAGLGNVEDDKDDGSRRVVRTVCDLWAVFVMRHPTHPQAMAKLSMRWTILSNGMQGYVAPEVAVREMKAWKAAGGMWSPRFERQLIGREMQLEILPWLREPEETRGPPPPFAKGRQVVDDFEQKGDLAMAATAMYEMVSLLHGEGVDDLKRAVEDELLERFPDSPEAGDIRQRRAEGEQAN